MNIGNLKKLALLCALISGNAMADMNIDQSFTGSWFNQATSGEGFNFEVLPNNSILVYFYTFDPAGNNVFLVGVGNYTGANATVPLFTTTGGAFPPAFNESKITNSPWGSLLLHFDDCDHGTATWVVTGGNTQNYTNGSLDIVRITGVAGLSCGS